VTLPQQSTSATFRQVDPDEFFNGVGVFGGNADFAHGAVEGQPDQEEADPNFAEDGVAPPARNTMFSALEPNIPAGTEYWMPPLMDYITPLLNAAGPPTAVYQTAHINIGAGTDLAGMKIWDIPFHVVSASDARPCSRQWLNRHFADEIDVLFASSEEVCNSVGHCRLRNRHVSCREGELHLSCVRFPNLPFGVPDDAAVEKSAAYNLLMEVWPDHLRTQRPHQFLAEASMDMLKARLPDGTLAFDAVKKLVSTSKYHMVHFHVPHSMWGEPGRTHLFMAGFSERAGGKAAAFWFTTAVLNILKHLRSLPPEPLWQQLVPLDGVNRMIGKLDPTWNSDEISDSQGVLT